jgi:hypothetical protein
MLGGNAADEVGTLFSRFNKSKLSERERDGQRDARCSGATANINHTRRGWGPGSAARTGLGKKGG